MRWQALFIVALLAVPLAAQAQIATDASAVAGTASISPTTALVPGLSPICTDRPTKANYACTVDVGHFQYEGDLLNASFQKLGGVTTDTVLVLNPTLKYGLTPNLDIEANISPLEIVRTHDEAGSETTLAGVSDLYLRLKYKVLDTAGDKLEVALLPYVKAPTARSGLGNGAVEGGAIVPINYKLSDILTLTAAPELDAYKDARGGGRHLNTAQLVNLGVSLPNNFTVYAELWGDWNFDPTGTTRQYSADFALAYNLTSEMQLDTGVNFGLNRETAGVQAYVGLSQKF